MDHPYKVIVVIITADYIQPPCYEAIRAQDYPNFDILVHIRKPKFPDEPHPIVKKYLNCTDNREAARKVALASEAEKFLFVDSDVVIPPHTISELAKQPFDVIGGYYQVAGDTRYTCGRWVGDNQFWNLRRVEPSVVKVDSIGMGCAMFSRRALEKITFQHGTDQLATLITLAGSEPVILGDCAVLGKLLQQQGFELYMDGEVICDHIPAN